MGTSRKSHTRLSFIRIIPCRGVVLLVLHGDLVLSRDYCLFFRDSDHEGDDLAEPEFRGLWEEDENKVCSGEGCGVTWEMK